MLNLANTLNYIFLEFCNGGAASNIAWNVVEIKKVSMQKVPIK